MSAGRAFGVVAAMPVGVVLIAFSVDRKDPLMLSAGTLVIMLATWLIVDAIAAGGVRR